MLQQVRSPLKRIGGKSASAERIVSLFPHPSCYDRYVEPCCGALHVFFAKPQYGHEEVVNDLDGNLYAFWMVMLTDARVLQEAAQSLPYARALYYAYYRSLFDGTPLSQFDRALRYFYCLRSTGTGWLRKSPVGWDSRGSNVQAFRSAIELFDAVQERFHRVAIDNRDVLDTVKRYATSLKDPQRVLFYLDAPYFGVEHYYEASKHGFPHTELAALLNEVQGYVALSYYPHPEIDCLYPSDKWHRVTWQQHKSSQVQLATREEDSATEMLLTNYPDSTPASLWTESEAV